MSSTTGLNKPLSPIEEGAQQQSIHVIREVYENGNPQEAFEAELEKALEAKVTYIIIEPARLGDETGRWITVGNCLHKTAVLSGILSTITGSIWPERPIICAPLCAVSFFCTGLYTVCWSYDHCCQYQVERDPKKLAKVTNPNEMSSPVVLVYSDNKRTKYLHRGVTLLASAFCIWQIYKIYK